jgi:hypothetical protein
MINIKNKKLSISALLISIVLIIYASIIKEKTKFPIYNDFGSYMGYTRKNVIRFLDIQLLYNDTLFFLFIVVILSILALIFMDDDFIYKKLHGLSTKLFSVNEYKEKINNLLKKPMNRIIIGIVTLCIILLFVGRCSEPKKSVLKETDIEDVDTVALPSALTPIEQIDSTAAIEVSPVEEKTSSNSSETINIFDPEELAKFANSSPTVKLIEQGRKKYSPNAKVGDVTMQGVDDDEINSLYGNGSSTLSLGQLEAARSKRNR